MQRQESGNRLANCRILVVEDDYLIAEEVIRTLKEAGAEIIGPAPTVQTAMGLAASPDIDGAILDINLRGELAFAVADALHDRGVPFILTTGYDTAVLPERFACVPRCEKPFDLRGLRRALGQILPTVNA